MILCTATGRIGENDRIKFTGNINTGTQSKYQKGKKIKETKKNIYSESGNRTPSSRMKTGNVNRYTNSDCCNIMQKFALYRRTRRSANVKWRLVRLIMRGMLAYFRMGFIRSENEFTFIVFVFKKRYRLLRIKCCYWEMGAFACLLVKGVNCG